MVKYDSKEEFEEHTKSNLHTSSKKQNVDMSALVGGMVQPDSNSRADDKYSDSSDDNSGSDFSGSDDEEDEDQIAEQVANLVYNNSRDSEDINYDHY